MKFMKIGIDTAMLILLFLLMAYSLVGEAAHEWLGIAMFALFVLHYILNARWSKALFKGKYTPFRIIQTTIVVLGSMISGILLSRTVFAFLGSRPLQAIAQTFHLLDFRFWGCIGAI